MAAITLNDVARQAGVSVPTVSRVMRGVNTVDPELKDRVLSVASKLGYQPNRMAQSLRARRTGVIGYISANSPADFHTVLAQGIHDAGVARGYAVLTGKGTTPEHWHNYQRIFAGFQVEGLIVTSDFRAEKAIYTAGEQLPIVEVDRQTPDHTYPAVLLDNHKAMELAVDHLVSLGHRHVALLYGTELVSTEVERREGFLQAMDKHGLPIHPDLIQGDTFTEEGGLQATARLLACGQPVTALVTTTNEMLAGAVQVLRERQIRIPEELSLIGLDDTRWTRLMSPPITVIAQPAYDMGLKAVEVLIAAIEGSTTQHQSVYRFLPELLQRSSTSPPRAP